MAKVPANELRPGMVIDHDGNLWRVVTSKHVKVSGRGGACMQVGLRGVIGDTKASQRFRTDEKLERLFVDCRDMRYLYSAGDSHVFMDLATYEQRDIDGSLLGGLAGFLLPELEVKVQEHDGRPLGVELPAAVELEVVETEPRVKGATVTGSYKPAKVSTGITVMVPPFISAGERVRVSTATGEYLERAS